MRRTTPMALLAAVLLLPACGGEDDPAGGGGSTPSATADDAGQGPKAPTTSGRIVEGAAQRVVDDANAGSSSSDE